MSPAGFRIVGSKSDSDRGQTIMAEVLAPRHTPDDSEYHCEVRCPNLLDAPKRIVGMNPNHAIEMARLFVLELFRHDGVEIVDEDSKPAP